MIEAPTRTNRWVLAAFLAVVVIGGSNFVAVRFSNRELPPFWGASIRFFAAAGLLATLALLQRLEFPRGRALLGAIAFGVVGFGAFYAFAYWGLRHVPAGLAAVVAALAPLLTFGLAVVQGQEPFRWRPLAGGAVALIGIAVMFRGSMSEAVPTLSLLAVLAAAVCAAEGSVIIKWFPKSHPVTTNVVAMLTGAIVLLILSVVANEPRLLAMHMPTWSALLYLVVVGSSALFVLFLFVLEHWSASSVAYQFVLFPIVAVTLSAVLERVPFHSTLISGMALVLGGVYLGVVSQIPFVRTRQRLGTEPCLNCPE
jgi:drug/metabolite transporter (DMT)-like permease